jgi:FMN phosphatase YigB (HAD superfamily)
MNDDLKESAEEYRKRLSAIAVTRPVTTIEEAKNPETVMWAIGQLNNGVRLDELRRVMGLGPSRIDKRWRVLRGLIFDQLPQNEDESLKEAYGLNEEHLERIEAALQQIEAKLASEETSKEDTKTRHHYQKMHLDALFALLEADKSRHQMFLDVKKAKATKNGVLGGVNIIIKTNTPRPIKEAIAVTSKLLDEDDE